MEETEEDTDLEVEDLESEKLEVEDEEEVEVVEMFLDDDEINELIEKLKQLKETKESVTFEMDDENLLIINHEDNMEAE